MPTVGPNRELLQCNVPIGCKDRLDRMLEYMKKVSPAKDKHNFSDRGTFVSWMLDKLYTLINGEQEYSSRLAQREKELDEREREIEEREKELAEIEKNLYEADVEMRKRVRISAQALQLLTEAVDAGVTKDEILSVLRVFKRADLDPAEVAHIIEKEDIPNFVAWARQLKESCLQGAETLSNLKEEIAAHKKALEQLKQYREEAIKEINNMVEDYERAKLAVARVCAAARDTGLYIDYIKQSCKANNADSIQDLLHEPALVVAGTILEAVASAYGDKEITLVPGPGRLMPVKATIREIARSLAPPEAYKEQQKAQVKMEVKAEAIATAS